MPSAMSFQRGSCIGSLTGTGSSSGLHLFYFKCKKAAIPAQHLFH